MFLNFLHQTWKPEFTKMTCPYVLLKRYIMTWYAWIIGLTKNHSNLLCNITYLFLNGGSINDEDDSSSDRLVLVKESGPYSLMTRDINQAKETLDNTRKKDKLQENISISKNKTIGHKSLNKKNKHLWLSVFKKI